MILDQKALAVLSQLEQFRPLCCTLAGIATAYRLQAELMRQELTKVFLLSSVIYFEILAHRKFQNIGIIYVAIIR